MGGPNGFRSPGGKRTMVSEEVGVGANGAMDGESGSSEANTL
jgi:hypothetical protein